MKIVSAVFADFAEPFLGGASALATPIAGESIIVRTLRRQAAITECDEHYLVVRPRDEALARAAVAAASVGDRITVLPIDDGNRPRRELIRAARKWSLDSWRGTPLGTTWFDEYVEPLAVARVLDHAQAFAALCLDGCMPLLDVEIANGMVAYQRENADEAKFVFTQAPPGLAGIVLPREVTRELLETQSILGHLLTYRPEAPRMDLITRAPCFRIAAELAQNVGRVCGDTIASRRFVEAAIAANVGDATLASIAAPRSNVPEEVELELTTRDPLADTTLRPRGDRVPGRELVDIDAVARIARELAAATDTSRLVLAGCGDPLLHPQFAETLAGIRAAGVCAVCVTTPLVELTDRNLDALLSARVDTVEVLLDADTPETYAAVHRADQFDRVLANIERIQSARRELHSPWPIVIPSITRCAAAFREIEPFFDRWIRAVGTAVIRGHSRYGGAIAADALPGMTPLVRGSCRRLDNRLTLLADGRAIACDQDVAGTLSLGDWRRQSLSEIWHATARKNLYQSHRRMDLSAYPVCVSCSEWNRA
ncbi:MAG: radical SAM/SPASM domain-containing protein [Phycisphaerae bacterium]